MERIVARLKSEIAELPTLHPRVPNITYVMQQPGAVPLAHWKTCVDWQLLPFSRAPGGRLAALQ
jgi:hypothetical protein